MGLREGGIERNAAEHRATDWTRRGSNETARNAAEKLVGLGRLELPTSPLSGVRSSHLSYRPNLLAGNILRDSLRSSNNRSVSV